MVALFSLEAPSLCICGCTPRVSKSVGAKMAPKSKAKAKRKRVSGTEKAALLATLEESFESGRTAAPGADCAQVHLYLLETSRMVKSALGVGSGGNVSLSRNTNAKPNGDKLTNSIKE